MLTFEQKLEIIQSFPELQRKDVSLKRVNFHYEESVHEKKIVVYHLHPNGNGFVYAALLQEYPADDRGFVNIRDFSAAELRELVQQSIASLSGSADGDEAASSAALSKGQSVARHEEAGEHYSADELISETWHNEDGQALTLRLEGDLWYTYSGDNVDMAFESREEADEYLAEEGFLIRK
ncbi:hypothetical protein EBB07_24875 [Paenibacillaceae bacterium]|nr:hypothetical protein EBB07_24875 [Paenibacillaceae bacterium]